MHQIITYLFNSHMLYVNSISENLGNKSGCRGERLSWSPWCWAEQRSCWSRDRTPSWPPWHPQGSLGCVCRTDLEEVAPHSLLRERALEWFWTTTLASFCLVGQQHCCPWDILRGVSGTASDAVQGSEERGSSSGTVWPGPLTSGTTWGPVSSPEVLG